MNVFLKVVFARFCLGASRSLRSRVLVCLHVTVCMGERERGRKRERERERERGGGWGSFGQFLCLYILRD